VTIVGFHGNSEQYSVCELANVNGEGRVGRRGSDASDNASAYGVRVHALCRNSMYMCIVLLHYAVILP
jgi:hypothetical protein